MLSPNKRVWAAVLVVLGAAVALPQEASGQPATAHGSQDGDDAVTLFKRGKQLALQKKWSGAYEAFKRSFELKRSHDTATNLGQAAYKLKKFGEAAHYLDYALRDMPPSEPASKRSTVASMLEAAQKEVTTVRLAVVPVDANVAVDGKSHGSVSALDGRLYLDVGEHAISASAPGFEKHTESIAATKGAERTLTLKLVRATQSSGASLPSSGLAESNPGASGNGDPQRNGRSDDGPSARTVTLVAGAALTLTAGVLTGVFALQKSGAKSDAEDALDQARGQFGAAPCAANANATVCRDVADANDRKESAGTRADVALVATGVLGAATIATYFLWPANSAKGAVRFSPAVTTSRTGLMVHGSF